MVGSDGGSGLLALAAQIEAASDDDAGLCRLAFEQVGAHLPALDRALVRNGALGSVDAVLLIVDHGLPGWEIALRGRASETLGDWHVSLRRGDDDALRLGTGQGPRLSNVLIAALLRALAQRSG